MTSFLDKLNLRPGERRLVVFVGLAVFVVLNIWLVWPQFGQVSFWNNRQKAAQDKLDQFKAEIARKNEYEKKLKELERLGGQVAPDEQAIQLQKDVLSYAALTGVAIESSSTPQRSGFAGKTNEFFEEQTMQISVNTGERELVDFLYNLGTRNSMIRVRHMNISPDPTRMRLKAQIALVASYQKKPPPRSITSVTRASRPGGTNVPTSGTNAPAARPPASTRTKPVPMTGKPPSAATLASTSKTNVVRTK